MENLDSPESHNISDATSYRLEALLAGSLRDLTELDDLTRTTTMAASASAQLQPPTPRGPPLLHPLDISGPAVPALHREDGLPEGSTSRGPNSLVVATSIRISPAGSLPAIPQSSPPVGTKCRWPPTCVVGEAATPLAEALHTGAEGAPTPTKHARPSTTMIGSLSSANTTMSSPPRRFSKLPVPG